MSRFFGFDVIPLFHENFGLGLELREALGDVVFGDGLLWSHGAFDFAKTSVSDTEAPTHPGKNSRSDISHTLSEGAHGTVYFFLGDLFLLFCVSFLGHGVDINHGELWELTQNHRTDTGEANYGHNDDDDSPEHTELLLDVGGGLG